ncbi:7144_t:CDS:1 [Racocetra persica]|uniref:7144_t:CDS:1 n=1 Tax=Racocetra persica TaxID=160502 RepID=A0ACA9L102_9GLOM|nr:7144_t:CDS:1 [Racocetra persica]
MDLEIVVDVFYKLENNDTDEDFASSLALEIIKVCEKEDGYSYIYYKKYYNKQIKTISFTYWYNCHYELEKRMKKNKDESKQCNREPRIAHYDCKGTIVIKVDLQNTLAFIKLNHTLHPRPQHFNVNNEIKEYIQANMNHSASELYQQIVTKKMEDYELLTTNQIYYW